MRGKKFISLTLSTMLCLQLLPTASFAAAPATDTGNAGLIAEGDYAIAGNGVRVTYDADGQTITLYRTEGSGLIQMSKPSPLGGPVVGEHQRSDGQRSENDHYLSEHEHGPNSYLCAGDL